jgi:hypothetical protein
MNKFTLLEIPQLRHEQIFLNNLTSIEVKPFRILSKALQKQIIKLEMMTFSFFL